MVRKPSKVAAPGTKDNGEGQRGRSLLSRFGGTISYVPVVLLKETEKDSSMRAKHHMGEEHVSYGRFMSESANASAFDRFHRASRVERLTEKRIMRRITTRVRTHLCVHTGRIAQLVEQRTENPCVEGSNPPPTTMNLKAPHLGLFSS